ncbi:hypothetical protein [Allosalinactinospora lopnorensis]|uniref:hypothetical protein n=1 Tax=Allosalinactinospora lopnorensis TaxID=1352348 RepID=UPI000623DF23|nr:hypothetical protein [Allosalinactinospora lopnorensis]
MSTAHAQPVHLWLLWRPTTPSDAATHVRMTDLTRADLDGSLEAASSQQAEVAPVDLLDDLVDLTPAHHTEAVTADYPAEYAAARDRLQRVLNKLADALPTWPRGPRSWHGRDSPPARWLQATVEPPSRLRPRRSSPAIGPSFRPGVLPVALHRPELPCLTWSFMG